VASTAEQRLPLAREETGRVIWRLLMPLMPTALLAICAGCVIGGGTESDGAPLYLIALIGGSLFSAVNAFIVARRLMHHLPRRVRAAPVLLLLPRDVAIGLLAAGGAAALAVAVATCGCAITSLVNLR
jgi:hypothetical protein